MTTILTNRDELQKFRRQQNGKILGLVPTMGNLHAGHISLIHLAQKKADTVIVSIFVNPTQFAPDEDLGTYPRTFEQDLQKLRDHGVAAVFFPDEHSLYPHGSDDTISIVPPKAMTQTLCGIERPNFFQGVATVVAKLFQLVQPDIAVFGEKDFQQLAIIRRLNEELFLGIKIYASATVREASGLAMSSRNQYLSPEEQKQAAYLYKALQDCRQRLLNGESLDTSLSAAHNMLTEQGISVEYLSCRNVNTLSETTKIDQAILLVAARLGKARLIDNLRITATW